MEGEKDKETNSDFEERKRREFNSERVRYVTRYELLLAQDELRKETALNIGKVDDKVDAINNIVLPLAESSKLTAENTAKLMNTMEEFTKEQRETNNKFIERVHGYELKTDVQQLVIDSLEKTSDTSDTDKALITANMKLIGIVITASGTVIVAIIKLAPILFE